MEKTVRKLDRFYFIGVMSYHFLDNLDNNSYLYNIPAPIPYG